MLKGDENFEDHHILNIDYWHRIITRTEKGVLEELVSEGIKDLNNFYLLHKIEAKDIITHKILEKHTRIKTIPTPQKYPTRKQAAVISDRRNEVITGAREPKARSVPKDGYRGYWHLGCMYNLVTYILQVIKFYSQINI